MWIAGCGFIFICFSLGVVSPLRGWWWARLNSGTPSPSSPEVDFSFHIFILFFESSAGLIGHFKSPAFYTVFLEEVDGITTKHPTLINILSYIVPETVILVEEGEAIRVPVGVWLNLSSWGNLGGLWHGNIDIIFEGVLILVVDFDKLRRLRVSNPFRREPNAYPFYELDCFTLNPSSLLVRP